jgi:hypothetical protein
MRVIKPRTLERRAIDKYERSKKGIYNFNKKICKKIPLRNLDLEGWELLKWLLNK